MSESLSRSHGLERFLRSFQRPESEAIGVQARVLSDITQINLRGNPNDVQFKTAAQNVLGQPLPIEPNIVTDAEHRVYWLGPDEWLIVSAAFDAPRIAGRLVTELSNLPVAVNDISGGQVTLRLSGSSVVDVLSKGCTLDFHPNVFRPGDCAQSGLAKAAVLIGCVDRATVELIVRRSFSEYVSTWLQRAAQDCGIEFR